MIQAHIHDGRIEPEEPIPSEWEGQRVKIVPLSPDDPMPDLEARLAALTALGPMEFEPGEREAMAQMLDDLDHVSRDAMQRMMDRQP